MALAYPAYGSYPEHSLSRRQSMSHGPMTPMHPYSDDGVYDRHLSTPMSSQYSMGSHYYGGNGMAPMMHRRASSSYDDYDLDHASAYYPEQRMITPAIPPRPYSRLRRRSTVSFSDSSALIPHRVASQYRRGNGQSIKFKRKGSFTAGITLGEAQSRHGVRLSNNGSYTLNDLHADTRGTILLRVHWAGYNSLTYEIPLDDGDYRIDLRTVARRVTRACLHYFQTNMIPVQWERVELHHLEEISAGTWQPMLSAR